MRSPAAASNTFPAYAVPGHRGLPALGHGGVHHVLQGDEHRAVPLRQIVERARARFDTFKTSF